MHVSLDENGAARLDALIKGDTVREVLDYVEFDAEALLGKLRTDVETAVRAGRVDYEGAGRLLRFYEDGLHGYTYLGGIAVRRLPVFRPAYPGRSEDRAATSPQACCQVVGGDAVLEQERHDRELARRHVAEVGAAGGELRQHASRRRPCSRAAGAGR